MEPGRAWTTFGGVSLALMGASLIAGSRRLASDNLAWRREWRRAAGRDERNDRGEPSLARVYRAAGALVAFAGCGVLSSGQVVVAAPAHPWLGGSMIAGVGIGAAALKFLARSSGPRFLDREPLAAAPRPWDERLAEAATWGLCAVWAAFGGALAAGFLR